MTEIVVVNTPPLFPQPQTGIHPLSCSQGNHMVTYRFVWDSERTAVCLHQIRATFTPPQSQSLATHNSLQTSPHYSSIARDQIGNEVRTDTYTLQFLHQTHKSDVKSAFSAPP